jgi:hypothetical protein
MKLTKLHLYYCECKTSSCQEFKNEPSAYSSDVMSVLWLLTLQNANAIKVSS